MRFFPALVFILIPPLTTHAQLQIHSADELLSYADKQAPAALQSRLQPEAARQDVQLQASALYPRVSAFATGDYYPIIPTQVIPAEVLGGAPGTYLKAQFGLPYVFTAGAELSMPVINLERWAQVARARAQYQQSQWSSRAALENFHMQLLQAYYQSLITGEVLQLNRENETTAGELLRVMDARNQAGVVNPSDYNRTKNLQLDVRSTGIGYNRQLTESRNTVAALLNTRDSLVFTESLGAFSWPLLSDMADPSSRPGWLEADDQLRVASLSLAESRRGGLPRLSLAGRYAYNMQSQFEAGLSNVEFSAANIGLRLDVPLFQGNYYRALQHKNKIQLQSVELDRQRTQATLTRQQKDWYVQYQAALIKHGVLEDKVEAASDNLRIARLNIVEGLMEFDEFNNIFMEYNRARMEQLQNLADGILYYLLSTQKF